MSRSVIPGDYVPVVGMFSEIVVLTSEQRNAFLEMVAGGAAVQVACTKLGVPRMSVMRLLKSDPQFAVDYDIALNMRGGALLEIALEQCTVGVDEVLTYQGHIQYEYPNGYSTDETGAVVPGTVRNPVTVKKLVTSNAMLLALLKAIYPDKFVERSAVDVNNRSAPTRADVVPDRITNNEDREKLIALLDKRALARATITDVDPDGDIL
jgi:hypothetical protein